MRKTLFIFLFITFFPFFSHSAYIDNSFQSYESFCDPSAANTMRASNLFTATSTAFLQYKSSTATGADNCLSLRGYPLSNIATTTTLYAHYAVERTAGTCKIAFGTGDFFTSAQTANISVFDQATYTTSSTSVTYALTRPFEYNEIWIGTRMNSGAAQTCTFYLTNITDSLGNDYFEIFDTSSGGGSSTTTVFYPLGLNAIIDDMNCFNSATGTDCIFSYASTTVPITPDVILAYLFIFAGALLGSYWLTLILTKR